MIDDRKSRVCLSNSFRVKRLFNSLSLILKIIQIIFKLKISFMFMLFAFYFGLIMDVILELLNFIVAKMFN